MTDPHCAQPEKTDPPVALREHLAPLYRPRDLLAHFLWCVVGEAEDKGLRLTYSEDFGAYDAAAAAQATSFYRTMPMFDPALYRGGDAFWLGAFDSAGAPVFLVAERLYCWPDRSAKEVFESLEIFYRAAKNGGRPGECCRVTAPSAATIRGRVSFSGGFWIAPDWRRRAGVEGLSEIGPRLARALALLKWETDYNVGVIEAALVAAGTPGRHGYGRCEEAVVWENSYYPVDYVMALVWTDPRDLLADLGALMVPGPRARIRFRRP